MEEFFINNCVYGNPDEEMTDTTVVYQIWWKFNVLIRVDMDVNKWNFFTYSQTFTSD